MNGIYAVLLAMYVLYMSVKINDGYLSLKGLLLIISWLIGIASIVLQFLL